MSENLVVCAKAQVKELEVGKVRVIKKVETFADLMMTTNGLEAKKHVILDLLENREDLLTDRKFEFRLSAIMWLLSNDCKFYLKAMRILQVKFPYDGDLYKIAYNNRHTLLKSHKEDREYTMQLIKTFFVQASGQSIMLQYILKPI